MEIQENSLGIFYMSRLLGLAPYTLKRDSKGRIESIQLNYWLGGYSALFIIVAASLTFRFIVTDSHSAHPIRMQTATSSFVTIFDVSIVVVVCTCGMVAGLIGTNNMRGINERLKEADKELVLFNDRMHDRKRGILMMTMVLISITVMLTTDIISRNRVIPYTPFYVLYYIMMGIQTQFAYTAFNLAKRYRRLNMAIESAFSLKKVMQIVRDHKVSIEKLEAATLPGLSATKLVTVSRAIQEETKLVNTFSSATNNNNVSTAVNCSIRTGPHHLVSTTVTRTNHFLERLSVTHAILGESVCVVSSTYGLTLLALLASCLLHLVATTYFLFLELLGETNGFVASRQFLWCCFHISRLLLIVEPCHMASAEASRTIKIVCDVLRNCKDTTIEHTLQRFWRQLLADKTHVFSACGMCKIDRQILTSLSGAIATYLVILIQFQKTDG